MVICLYDICNVARPVSDNHDTGLTSEAVIGSLDPPDDRTS